MNPEDTLLFVPGKDPTKLVVLFSAANAERFSLYKSLESYDHYDKLFLRDPHKRHWYQSGLGPHAPTPDAIAAKILESKRTSETKIYSAGVSMGGYASLLFACLGEFRAALAISPQTRLTPGFFRNPPRSINVPYPDVAKMMADNARTKFVTLAGDVDWIDNYSLSLLSDAPNITIRTFPKQDHTLPLVLNKRFTMAEIIEWFVEERDLEFGMKETPFDHKRAWIEPLQKAAQFYYKKRYSKAKTVLKAALDVSPEWVGGLGFLARLHFELDEMNEAAALWRKALEINSKLTEPHLRLAQLHQARKEPKEAKYHYKRLIKLRGRASNDLRKALSELEGMM